MFLYVSDTICVSAQDRTGSAEAPVAAQLMHVLICDMIKRNESDVGDIVFELLAKNSVHILLFYIVFSIGIFFITRCPILMRFASK